MLLRFLHAFTFFTLLAAAFHWYADTFRPTTAESTAPVATAGGSLPYWDEGAVADLEEQVGARKEFASFLDHVITELAEGRLALSEARDRVYYYCLAHQSHFLQNVLTVEAGTTPHDKLARMLLRAARDFQAEHDLPLSEPEPLAAAGEPDTEAATE